MKKILSAVMSLLVIFTMMGCAPIVRNPRYRLVISDNRYVINDVRKYYHAGDEVRIEVSPICDAALEVFLDDVPLGRVETHSDYWVYIFAMPNHHANLRINVYDYPFVVTPIENKTNIDCKVAYSDFNLRSYGMYMTGLVTTLSAWESIAPQLPDFKASYDDAFFNDNCLIVITGEKSNMGGLLSDVTLTEVEIIDDYGTTVDLVVDVLIEDSCMTAIGSWGLVIEAKKELYYNNLVVKTNFCYYQVA